MQAAQYQWSVTLSSAGVTVDCAAISLAYGSSKRCLSSVECGVHQNNCHKFCPIASVVMQNGLGLQHFCGAVFLGHIVVGVQCSWGRGILVVQCPSLGTR